MSIVTIWSVFPNPVTYEVLCINDNKMILQLWEYDKTNLTLQSRDNYLRILHYIPPC